VSGSITLSDADVADLEAGNFYLNVHSKENPGGFARGQLELPDAQKPAISPPDTGDGGLAAGATSPSWLLTLTLAVSVLSLTAFVVRKAA
jgi:hypothetical protein